MSRLALALTTSTKQADETTIHAAPSRFSHMCYITHGCRPLLLIQARNNLHPPASAASTVANTGSQLHGIMSAESGTSDRSEITVGQPNVRTGIGIRLRT